MKNNIKKYMFVFVLAISLSFSNVLAISNNSYNVSNDYESRIDAIYSRNKNFTVIDQNENDVLNQFIKDNQINYNLKDYQAILQYQSNLNLTIVKSNVVVGNGIVPYASKTYNLTKEFTDTIKVSSVQSVDVTVQCYAVVRVNENNGVITSFSGPSLSIVSVTSGLLSQSSFYNASTDYKWKSSTHRGITFYYNYGVKIDNYEALGTATTIKTPMYKKTLSY